MTDLDCSSHLARVERYFETLTPEALANIGDVYTENARFRDPFHTVQGLQPIAGIYRGMFHRLVTPRFVIVDSLLQDADAFLTWDFLFSVHGSPACVQSIHGATHLRFGSDGKIHYHRDYWDAAEEVYEKIPLVGSLMRLLKKAARGSTRHHG